MKLITTALACALSLATQTASAQAGSKDKAPATIQIPPISKEAAGFDTGVTVAKNPLECAIPENLIFETSSGFPRVEFFSCDKGKEPAEVSAIADYGRKSGTSLEKFGFTSSKTAAEQLRRFFPKDKFLCSEDKTGRQYLSMLKEGLRKKGVSYNHPAKMATKR